MSDDADDALLVLVLLLLLPTGVEWRLQAQIGKFQTIGTTSPDSCCFALPMTLLRPPTYCHIINIHSYYDCFLRRFTSISFKTTLRTSTLLKPCRLAQSLLSPSGASLGLAKPMPVAGPYWVATNEPYEFPSTKIERQHGVPVRSSSEASVKLNFQRQSYHGNKNKNKIK
jgi:hypothetical protein